MHYYHPEEERRLYSNFDVVAQYINSKEIGEMFSYKEFQKDMKSKISSFLLAIDYLEQFVDLYILEGVLYEEDDQIYKVLHHVPKNLTSNTFLSLLSVLIYKKEDLWKMWFMESYEEFIDNMKRKYHF
jgi:hypothetical protein